MFASLCLASAFVAAALEPDLLGEFFYHPRALALVHLVTLGWITCTILGASYLVGPVAFRTTIRATRRDAWAFALVAIGVIGMVGHFWIDEYGGMVWAAGTLLAGILLVAARVLPPILRAPVPGPVRLYVALAFTNLLAAGLLGSLIGLAKLGALSLPGALLANVYAHAHIAALGWAGMMAIGVGYRLLPMYLPAEMPRGKALVAPALLLQAGVIILAASLLVDSPAAWLGAGLILAGLGVFALHVRRMLANPRPAPAALPQPDLARIHILQSLLYLLAAAIVGVVLLAVPRSNLELHLVFVYGVFGLLGFLSQLIVGVAHRLLPTVVWMQVFVQAGYRSPLPSPHSLLDRSLQATTLLLWSLGVPLLALSLFRSWSGGISLAALALACAVVLDATNRAIVLSHLRRESIQPVPTDSGRAA